MLQFQEADKSLSILCLIINMTSELLVFLLHSVPHLRMKQKGANNLQCSSTKRCIILRSESNQ